MSEDRAEIKIGFGGVEIRGNKRQENNLFGRKKDYK